MKTSKLLRKCLISIGVIIVILLTASAIYLNDYYHTDEEAAQAFATANTVETYNDKIQRT